METLQSRIVVDGLIYPEGIRWAQDKVWFSDMFARRVYAHDPRTGETEVVAETDDLPSGLGFLPDGRLLIATMRDRKLLRLDPEGLTTVADLSSVSDLLNDMVVDARGRAYMDFYIRGGGGLILVEPDGGWRIVADDMTSPNGLAVTDEGRTLVVNDLGANRILAFDIAEDGGLSGRRTFADLGDCSPDGLCLDADGGAWVGQPFQGRFRRIVEGGEVTHEIAYGAKWGIAPVLGGPDRRSLFLCTAEITLEAIQRLMRDPSDAPTQSRGWIEVVDGVEVAGAGSP